MGIYLNPGDNAFQEALNSEIYVDKTGMIAYTNRVFKTLQKYICVSRPRRFGKSMAANMLAAYYSRTVDVHETFKGLKISQDASFATHFNEYDVISLNIQEFLSRSHSMDELLALLKKSVLWELVENYSEYRYFDDKDLSRTMADIYNKTNQPFVVIIDEWDCIFREYKEDHKAQKQYLDFLRDWLKDKAYLGLVYMTGILPIKKYGTHSALNMFVEFSMTNPLDLSEYVGFTESEVKALCMSHSIDFTETKAWYDGYYFEKTGSVYSPRSVVTAMMSGVFDTYWNQTETFEALKIYIDMNFDGLRESIIELMAGGRKKINTGKFANDMTTFKSLDDVMTLLVHLGYLGYDFSKQEVFIPNREIMTEYINATEDGGWDEVIRTVKKSDAVLQATWEQDGCEVAKGIEAAHFETSHLQYNDENALSYTVSLAYYSARQYYNVFRELPTGKGFADLVFVPRPKYQDKPALVVELKWNQDADTAIRQIKNKQYGKSLESYSGDILLVGINYDRATRIHECQIEECEKEKQ
jgi:hypothetical protein